jgi:hypothetical protein
MLSRFDDYPIHQTPEPVAHPASTDRNVYDRYWFNGYARDGEFYFGVAMGLYPNRRIMDCSFSIVRAGEQHAFHASRRAPQERGDTTVGPFTIEVVEPMRTLRVRLAPNDTGIACDLTFQARTACIEEGRQRLLVDGRPIMDATRFAQFGRWQGQIRYAGETVTVDAARVYGTKDRSWGIRPVGEPEMGGAPPSKLPHIFFLWAPIHWEDFCTHFVIFENELGEPWHQEGMILPAYPSAADVPGIEDPGVERMDRLGHRIAYEPGTRRARAATITLAGRAGKQFHIDLEPLIRFQMKGLGYSHPKWGHGVWQGDLAVGGESWRSDELDPLGFENLHTQQVVRARMGRKEGVGVLEQLVIGTHAPSGFTEFLDGAAAE